MALEIERKFLLKNEDWQQSIEKTFIIKQGYLNSHEERTVRVRIKGEKGILTIKGKTVGATRAEYEYEIPKEDAENLISLCEKHIIQKTRYIVNENDHIWEIDVFEKENEGLVMAEVELESEEEKLTLPQWLGDEVTHDKRYYNSNLIKHPYTSW